MLELSSHHGELKRKQLILKLNELPIKAKIDLDWYICTLSDYHTLSPKLSVCVSLYV